TGARPARATSARSTTPAPGTSTCATSAAARPASNARCRTTTPNTDSVLMKHLMAAIFAAISFFSGPASSAEPAADPPLVTNGDVSLTRIDFEAYMDRVPEKLRAEFRADSERVKKTVDGLWVQRMVAERARKAGLAQDPIVASKLRQAQDAVLVEALMLQVEKDMKYPD